MKFNTLTVLCISLSLIITASCKKNKDSDPTNSNSTIIPNGILYASLTDVVLYQDTSTDSEDGLAEFYVKAGDTSMGLIDADSVTLNGQALEEDEQDHSYFDTNFEPFDFKNKGVNWHVKGNGSAVKSFSYNAGQFPEYKGFFPSVITKADGLNFTFNSATVLNADSVDIDIVVENSEIHKVCSANAGNVTITPAELKTLTGADPNDPYGAYVAIKAYTNRYVQFNTYTYQFIKTRDIYKTIPIK